MSAGQSSAEILSAAASSLTALRERSPLVHQITNYVVMNETANMTLCMGGSPVMAHAPEEVAEMVTYAGALVLNIGTLQWDWIESMVKAGKKANETGVPVVLDPVGVGATTMRTEAARRILSSVKVSVVRGNAAEVSVLAGVDASIKGVDAIGDFTGLEEQAAAMSRAIGATVAVTGPVDVISDGARTALVRNGDPMMARITGTGCMSSAVVGCFCAIDDDVWRASASALTAFGLAGERAAAKTPGRPGSFHVALYDEVALLTPESLLSDGRVDIH